MSILDKEVTQEIEEQFLVEEKIKSKKQLADKKQHLAEKKKGQPLKWLPSRRLPELKAPDGYRVAWKLNTPENIRRLKNESWEIANRLEHNIDVEMHDYYRKTNDRPGSEKESRIVHNELIAMLIPEEAAKAREEYHREETMKQTRSKIMDSSDPVAKFGKFKPRLELDN